MNSANIVGKLEELYPEPSLHLDAELHGPMTAAIEGLAGVVWWDTLATIPSILPERSSVYFTETRKATFGASLEDVAKMKGGPEAWKTAAQPGGAAEQVRDMLTKHRKDEGPFVLGSQLSYADLIAASVWECIEICGPEDYKRLMALDPTFQIHHDACRPYFKRDD
jgi:glutathione S-transferase